ncbi:ATP-binding cassette domain-containing protein [Lysinibacillus sp. Bpr_S20]|uniref:ATP-binding cassette domain-containing protein n=1 Tax=Lysinibacillus sp. Bpr_S20 TaxID=2933964 RepID=UPI0020112AD0|nr:ATP-binding cassette domain-containing protein [Lysinibacillus sp. Bpr_S20]MCL1699100.1 ATP-binding cassette domain-containing protein [Lysinibacillus sp. Bpr_S20]
MKIIHVKNIQKRFNKELVLNDINFDIKGSFGLLGPNGAGKTTLIRILCSIIQPTNGEIYADNQLNWKDSNAVKSNVGYLPQTFSFFKNASVYRVLEYIAKLKGISKSELTNEITQVLEGTNLMLQKDKKVKQLSGGMLRRLGIAQALLGNPNLLIVDEPTVGLDIEERVRFRQLLRKLGKDRIVLISSHIVEDIENTCDHICILKEGKVVVTGELNDLLASIDGKVKEVFLSSEQLNTLSNEIISIKELGSEYKVRYVPSNNSNLFQGTSVSPTLEDFYVYNMNHGDIQ